MASATELCNQANENYVSENYQKAVELYTEALKLEEGRDDILCHRAQANLQLGRLKGRFSQHDIDLVLEVVEDCDKAIHLNESNGKAYKKKGLALFQMDEIGKALDVFQEGQKRFASDPTYEDWLKKCEEKLGKDSSAQDKTDVPTAQAKAPPNIKYDWYQTHTHVVITILKKNVNKESLRVNAEDRTLKVCIDDPNGTSTSLDLTLAHKIDPQQASTRVYATKIEVKLKKSEGVQWKKLEGDPEEEAEILPTAAAPNVQEPPSYPSSSHYTRDWDKLAAEVTEEEKNEKLEGDAALNQFFQKIYADASDETKRAMMKSFSESGGTVLSTNWSEVGKDKVEVKPPDGMEFRKWEY
ncbi:sgt1, suppressor of g2 allele of skp1 [Plakobranchus ocellatus]|uniref:Sgt1, suppressor of g2 allele of skp1 n=1 Tax=Plakobranchus ocellatus TaxID=259542 RepID=A0AAV3XZ41_9GAST|nr:sgt1, suppressor of g2 allele of skp1 [Plakobranchus ocellatus]